LAHRPVPSGAVIGTGVGEASQYLSFFGEDVWFGSLDPVRRAEMLGQCRIRRLQDGEALYSAGDPPDGLYGLISGQIQLVNYQALGKQVISIVVQPGRWFGELSMLDGKPRPNQATAVGRTQLAVLTMSSFQKLIAQSFDYYRDVTLLICARSRWAAENLTSVLSSSAETRLARILLSLSRGATGSGADVHLNQDDLAGMIGVTRQRVNTLLRKLEQRGVITLGYARVGIIDRAALHRFLD
jgi:CRP/FNR family transcriptional regulator, cyclic AMP receptor protein